MLAAHAVGFWPDAQSDLATKDRRFEPNLPSSQARALRERWDEAVSRSKAWQPSA
jgi:glycerol kinase